MCIFCLGTPWFLHSAISLGVSQRFWRVEPKKKKLDKKDRTQHVRVALNYNWFLRFNAWKIKKEGEVLVQAIDTLWDFVCRFYWLPPLPRPAITTLGKAERMQTKDCCNSLTICSSQNTSSILSPGANTGGSPITSPLWLPESPLQVLRWITITISNVCPRNKVCQGLWVMENTWNLCSPKHGSGPARHHGSKVLHMETSYVLHSQWWKATSFKFIITVGKKAFFSKYVFPV